MVYLYVDIFYTFGFCWHSFQIDRKKNCFSEASVGINFVFVFGSHKRFFKSDLIFKKI